MRMRSSVRLLSVPIIALALALPAGAQTRYQSFPEGTTVNIHGTSTLHEWDMTGTIIGGYIEFGPGVKLDPSAADIPGAKDGKVPVKLHALIPVETVHSKAEHLPEVMDRLMKNALKADQFPRIEYHITEMDFKGPHAAGKPFDVNTTGNLSIAGTTNSMNFPATIEVLPGDKIKVNAVVPLKMTAFKVDPPAPNIGAGAMRCGDDVTITINWTLKLRK